MGSPIPYEFDDHDVGHDRPSPGDGYRRSNDSSDGGTP